MHCRVHAVPRLNGRASDMDKQGYLSLIEMARQVIRCSDLILLGYRASARNRARHGATGTASACGECVVVGRSTT